VRQRRVAGASLATLRDPFSRNVANARASVFPQSAAPSGVMVYLVGGDFSGDAVGVATTVHGFTVTRSKSLNAKVTAYDESAGTVVYDLADNTLRIAKTLAGTKGALVEPARTNLVMTGARLFTGGSWTSAGTTRTADVTSGPDGNSVADRLTTTSTINGAVYNLNNTATAGRNYAGSVWHKSVSGSVQTQFGFVRNATNQYAVSSLSPTAWTRSKLVTNTTVGTSVQFVVVDARNRSTSGGLTAANRDVYVDFGQVEEGNFTTSPVFTGSQVESRDADKLTVATSSIRTPLGYVKFYCKFEAPAAIASMPEPGASSSLYMWAAGPNYAVRIDTSTGLVYATGYCVAVGNFRTVNSTTGVSFSAGDTVELWVVIGNDKAPVIKFRVNGGAVTTPALSSADKLTVIDPTELFNPNRPFASADVLNYGGAYVFPGVFSAVGFVTDASAPDGF